MGILYNLFENKMFSMTANEYVDYINKLGKTFIFFDTETTGLVAPKEQLTEISAVACETISGNFEKIDTFSVKVKLMEPIRSRFTKGTDEYNKWKSKVTPKSKFQEPDEILKMTRYGEHGRKYFNQEEALQSFKDWIDTFDSPVLVAQNAKFDMSFITKSGIAHEYKVIDTAVMFRYFVVPIFQHLANNGDEEAQNILEKMTKIHKGDWRFYSVSLGFLAPALNVNIDEWHNAFADVKIMIEVFKKALQFMKSTNVSFDDTKNYAGKQLKFMRKMVRKRR